MQSPLDNVAGERSLEVDLFEVAVRRELGGEPMEAEHHVLDADGVGHWITSNATPLRGLQGGIRGAIVVAHDLTERKLALEALQSSEERFRRQYKGFPLPTYSWIRDGDDFVMQDFNDAARAIDEGDIGGLVGERASERYAAQPEILDNFRAGAADQRTLRREIRHRFVRT